VLESDRLDSHAARYWDCRKFTEPQGLKCSVNRPCELVEVTVSALNWLDR
jgi:hypothetical protein